MANLHLSTSAERTTFDNPHLWPTFYQLQKSYSFCQKFIKGKAVLEMGCGPGYGTYKISKFVKKIVGVDKDSATIKKDKNRHQAANLDFICAEALTYEPDFPPDVIIAFQFIEHLPNPLLFLQKVKRLLKKDGSFLASVPNRLTQSSLYDNPYHFREYSPDDFSALLSGCFTSVNLYGVYGDKLAYTYEMARRKQVRKILSLDKFGLRYLLPRFIRGYFLDFLTLINRKIISSQNPNYFKITEENYRVLPKTEGAIDIIAVCKK